MQIKRFEAKDMTTALAMIKQAFGPDAVILSAKSIRTYGVLGGARTKGVEVTAAIDPAAKRPAPAAMDETADDVVTLSTAAARRRTNGRLMTSINSGLAGLKDKVGRRTPAPAPQRPAARPGGRLRRCLEGQGVNRVIVERCLRHTAPSDGDLPGALAAALSSVGIVGADDAWMTGDAPAVLVFAGPSGVGKTTTVIKLATRMAVDEGRTVGLLTLDHQRIGAVEQMRLYADILQLPMAPVFDTSSLKAAMAAFADCEVILVDTPGINPVNGEALAALRRLLRPLRRPAVHLVVSAGAKEEDLDRTLEGFGALSPQALVMTKFDESLTCGNVVNLLHRHRLPLAYVSDGGDIPEDLHEGSARWLADRLMTNAAPAAEAPRPSPSAVAPAERADASPPPAPSRRIAARRPQGAAQPFVANSNSDIFHRTDCKWTKMIKPDNFVSFASMEDALSQGFNPCRYCKPTPQAAEDRRLAETGVHRLAGYR